MKHPAVKRITHINNSAITIAMGIAIRINDHPLSNPVKALAYPLVAGASIFWRVVEVGRHSVLAAKSMIVY